MVFATWKALRSDHDQLLEAERQRHEEVLTTQVTAQVTDRFSESVATAVREEAPPTAAGADHDGAWERWWQRVIDRLKSRPGGLV